MKHLIALVCLMMFAAAPLSLAQDKAKPAAPMVGEMAPKDDGAKREATAKQKAKLARRSCEKQAKAQKLKGDVRKKFIKDCMMR